MHRLDIKRDLEALPCLYAFCEEQGTDSRTMLALEEAFVNVVNHSEADDISLTCCCRGDDMVFVLEDNGAAFDPTAYAASCQEDAASLKKGGQGIRIMRSMMDSIHYRRENGKNILTLIKSNKQQ